MFFGEGPVQSNRSADEGVRLWRDRTRISCRDARLVSQAPGVRGLGRSNVQAGSPERPRRLDRLDGGSVVPGCARCGTVGPQTESGPFDLSSRLEVTKTIGRDLH